MAAHRRGERGRVRSALTCCLAVAFVLALLVRWADRTSPEPWETARCQRLEAMTVFSHCAASGAANETGVVTEARVLALVARGIASFDMDLFWSTDGVLYVGHPRLLGKTLGGVDVFGLASRDVPAATLTVARLLELAASADDFRLALDLKGGHLADYASHLERLRGAVVARGLQRRVWLWAESSARVAELGGDGVLFGKPLKDVGAPLVAGRPNCSSQVQGRGDEHRYAFLGPSLGCANEHLLHGAATSAWRRAPRFYVVWVVDREFDLRRLVEYDVAVTYVVSNRPLRLQQHLAALRDEARCDQDPPLLALQLGR